MGKSPQLSVLLAHAQTGGGGLGVGVDVGGCVGIAVDVGSGVLVGERCSGTLVLVGIRVGAGVCVGGVMVRLG